MYRFKFPSLVVAFAIALSACGSDAATPDPVAATESTVAGSAPFPVTVEADNGSVTIEALPTAIVSLSPSLTEMVYAVGAGDQVIAVDQSSNYPAGTPVTDLSGFRPNVEAIGDLQPDLVLVARDRDGIVETLESVGITVLLLEGPDGVEGIAPQIELVGAATGHAAAGVELGATTASEIDRLLLSLPGRAEPISYYYELSADYHSVTAESLIGSILTAAGLSNIADDVDPAAGAYPQLSAEYILDENPELMFMAHTDGSVPTLDELAQRPGWSGLSAHDADSVIFLDSDIASRWGPRTVELVTQVVAAVQDR